MVVTDIVSKVWKRIKLKLNKTVIPAKKHTCSVVLILSLNSSDCGVKRKGTEDGENDRK